MALKGVSRAKKYEQEEYKTNILSCINMAVEQISRIHKTNLRQPNNSKELLD